MNNIKQAIIKLETILENGNAIESGTGIKGITRKVLFTNIKTALIPLGATQADGTQLNISSVN
ncbi:Phage Protein gp41 [Listeria monocytogenes]|nr:Phage Protein gp41 [Listeria monocytogenes]EFQ6878978.1 hypothetical protein [Listeria monocytogenes]QBZ14489.1 hypothetical protein FORC67_0085 [Listeria monocytogenes]RKA18743.1 hypothetical protein DYZ84_01115 [Listeria monocytogenes]CUK99777.1 hypothetical protein LM701067_220088 [Listeria monocytogenes]